MGARHVLAGNMKKVASTIRNSPSPVDVVAGYWKTQYPDESQNGEFGFDKETYESER